LGLQLLAHLFLDMRRQIGDRGIAHHSHPTLLSQAPQAAHRMSASHNPPMTAEKKADSDRRLSEPAEVREEDAITRASAGFFVMPHTRGWGCAQCSAEGRGTVSGWRSAASWKAADR